MTMTVEVFSSIFLCAYYRRSHRTCPAKKGVLNNFTLFTGNCVGDSSTRVFLWIWQIFKSSCFEEHLWMAASVTKALIVLLLSFLLIHTYKKFSIFNFHNFNANSTTRIKGYGDISYNSNVTRIWKCRKR